MSDQPDDPVTKLRQKALEGHRITQADLDGVSGKTAPPPPDMPPLQADPVAAAAAATETRDLVTQELLSWDQRPVEVTEDERRAFSKSVATDTRFYAQYELCPGASVRFRTRTLRETAALNNWFYLSTHHSLFPREIGVSADLWLHAALLVLCVDQLNGQELPTAEKPLQLLVDPPDKPGDPPKIVQTPGWLARVEPWFDRGALVHRLVSQLIHFERVYWTLLNEGRKTDFPSTAGAS